MVPEICADENAIDVVTVHHGKRPVDLDERIDD